MWTYQAFVALELANERVREANNQRLAALARASRPSTPRSIRRSAAVALASISTATAAVVRRLDECVADDLAERLGQESLPAAH